VPSVDKEQITQHCPECERLARELERSRKTVHALLEDKARLQNIVSKLAEIIEQHLDKESDVLNNATTRRLLRHD